MALSPEEVADLNRRARRRAERAAAEMSFHGVSSEEYLRRLRAKRRPSRRFEIGDIPAAVEIEDEPATLRAESRFANVTQPFAHPREASTIRTSWRASSNASHLASGSKAIPRSSPSKKVSAKPSIVSRGAIRQRSQPNLLQATKQFSSTTPDGFTPTECSVETQTSPPRSSLPFNNSKKQVRRAASVAALPSKYDAIENQPPQSTYHQGRHIPNQSSQAGIPPSNAPAPRGTLSKKGSLRLLKDTIRRVASAFELRPAGRDDAEHGDGVTLQHNKSTRSLLRYAGTRNRQGRLKTVDEEA